MSRGGRCARRPLGADASNVGSADNSLNPQEVQRKAASGEIRLDLKTGKTIAKLDDKPIELTGPAEPRDATVGRYRLSLGEATEAGVGFSRNIKRSLRATDAKSGKLLWRHDLAPEIVVAAPK